MKKASSMRIDLTKAADPMAALKILAKAKSYGLQKCLRCNSKPEFEFWHKRGLLETAIACKKGCLRHAVSTIPNLGPRDYKMEYKMFEKSADVLCEWWTEKMAALV